MRSICLLASAFLFLQPVDAQPTSFDGAWKFAKAVDYDNPSTRQAPPQSVTISLSGDSLKISATCSVHLRKRTYYAGGPFQALLKSGEGEASIAKFMQRSLNFDLKGAKDYFELDDVDCNKLGSDMLVSANQLIVIRGSDFFYAFDRQGGKPEATAATGASGEASLKVTSLPFSMADYAANCYPAIVKGVPQPSSKCAPRYYYHVASRSSTDPVSRLVGAHDYKKGGAGAADDDYDNPVSHGLHPVFLVFPPMGDVALVRVDDFEGHQETREQISGAFLAIKGGQVTDELNTGCELDVRFVCTDSDGHKYKLTANGKFQRVD